MKHILNDLSNEEKNSIREQHTGGMKVMTESFSRLLNAKLGDAKPLVSEQSVAGEPNSANVPLILNSTYEAIRSTDKQKYQITPKRIYTEPDSKGYIGYMANIVGPGTYQGNGFTAEDAVKYPNGGYDLTQDKTNVIGGNTEMGDFTIIRKIK